MAALFTLWRTLYDICEAGDVAAFERLKSDVIKNGIQRRKTRAGYTPLHIAVLNGHHEIVAKLLRYSDDVNPNVVDDKYQSALHLAIANDQLRCAKHLLLIRWRTINLRLLSRVNVRPIDIARAKGRELFHLLMLLTDLRQQLNALSDTTLLSMDPHETPQTCRIAHNLLLNIRLLLAKVSTRAVSDDEETKVDATFILNASRHMLLEACKQCFDKNAIWLLSVALQAGLASDMEKLFHEKVIGTSHPDMHQRDRFSPVRNVHDLVFEASEGVLGRSYNQFREKCILLTAVAEMARRGKARVLHWVFNEEQLREPTENVALPKDICWNCVREWHELRKAYHDERLRNLAVATQMARIGQHDDCLAVLLCHCYKDNAAFHSVAVKGGSKFRMLDWEGKQLTDAHMEAVMAVDDFLKDATFTAMCHGTTHLNASHNQYLTRVPRLLQRLTNLTELNFSHTGIGLYITSELFKMSKVTYLDLTNTGLEALPSGIDQFSSALKHLRLAQNHLDAHGLPASLGRSFISVLDLSENRFEQLPEFICQMRCLRKFVCSHNPQLRQLPAAFCLLDLNDIQLQNCSLPPEVMEASLSSRLWRVYREKLETEYFNRHEVSVGQVVLIGRDSDEKRAMVAAFQNHRPDGGEVQHMGILDLGTADFFSSCGAHFCGEHTTFVVCCTGQDTAQDINVAFKAVHECLHAIKQKRANDGNGCSVQEEVVQVVALAATQDGLRGVKQQCQAAGLPPRAVTNSELLLSGEDAEPGVSAFVQDVWIRSGANRLLVPESYTKIYAMLKTCPDLPLFMSIADFWQLVRSAGPGGSGAGASIDDPKWEEQLFKFLWACGRAQRFYSLSPQAVCTVCTDMVELSRVLGLLATVNARRRHLAAVHLDTLQPFSMPVPGIGCELDQMSQVPDGAPQEGVPGARHVCLDQTVILVRLLEMYSLAFRISPQYWLLPHSLHETAPDGDVARMMMAPDVICRHFIISQALCFISYARRLLAQTISQLPALLDTLHLDPSKVGVRCWKDGVAVAVKTPPIGKRLVLAVHSRRHLDRRGDVVVTVTAESSAILPRIIDITSTLWQDEEYGAKLAGVNIEQMVTFAGCAREQDGSGECRQEIIGGGGNIPQCQAHCPDALRDLRLTQPDQILADIQTDLIHQDSLEGWALIGHGGYGNVYRHEDIVVKVFKQNPQRLPTAMLSELRKEWSILLHTKDCPFIVRSRGIGVKRDSLLMEFGGEPLSTFAGRTSGNRDALPRRLRQRIVMQMFAAMAFLHERNITHRDLKLSNFLLKSRVDIGTEINVMLIDFGTSLFLQLGRSRGDTGTPCYRPPEMMLTLPQYSMEKDSLSDVFTIGLAVLELLTGKPLQAFGSPMRGTMDYTESGDTSRCLKMQIGLLTHATRNPDAMEAYVHLARLCVNLNTAARPFAHSGKLFSSSLEAQLLLSSINQYTACEPDLRMSILCSLPEAQNKAFPAGVAMATQDMDFGGKRHNRLVRLPLAGKEPVATSMRSLPWTVSVTCVHYVSRANRGRHGCVLPDLLVVGTRANVEIYEVKADGDCGKQVSNKEIGGSCTCVTTNDEHIYVGDSLGSLLVLRKTATAKSEFFERTIDVGCRGVFSICDMVALSTELNSVVWMVAKKGPLSKLIRLRWSDGPEHNLQQIVKLEESTLETQLRKIVLSTDRRHIWVSTGGKAFLWLAVEEAYGGAADAAAVADDAEGDVEIDLATVACQVPDHRWRQDENYIESMCCINGVLYVGSRYGLVYMFRDSALDPAFIACLQAHHCNVRHLLHAQMKLPGCTEEQNVIISYGQGNGLCPLEEDQTTEPVPLRSSARQYGCSRLSRIPPPEESQLFDACLTTREIPPYDHAAASASSPDGGDCSCEDEVLEAMLDHLYMAGAESQSSEDEDGEVGDRRLSATPSAAVASTPPIMPRRRPSPQLTDSPGSGFSSPMLGASASVLADRVTSEEQRTPVQRRSRERPPSRLSSITEEIDNHQRPPSPPLVGRPGNPRATAVARMPRVRHSNPQRSPTAQLRMMEGDDEGFREDDGLLPLVVSVWEAVSEEDIKKLDAVRQWITDS